MTLLLSLITMARSRICVRHQTRKRSPRSVGAADSPVAGMGTVLSPVAADGVSPVSCPRFWSSPAAVFGCMMSALAGALNGSSPVAGSAKGSSATTVWGAVTSPVAGVGRVSSAVTVCGENVSPVAGSVKGSSTVAGIVGCGAAAGVPSHGKVSSLKVSGTVSGAGDGAGAGAGL